MGDASAPERDERSAQVTKLLQKSRWLHQSSLKDKASREMPILCCHALHSSVEQLVSTYSGPDTVQVPCRAGTRPMSRTSHPALIGWLKMHWTHGCTALCMWGREHQLPTSGLTMVAPLLHFWNPSTPHTGYPCPRFHAVLQLHIS